MKGVTATNSKQVALKFHLKFFLKFTNSIESAFIMMQTQEAKEAPLTRKVMEVDAI